MDSLSVSASIVGLAATAAHITTTLCNLTMNIKDIPSLAGHLMAEIAAINQAMCNLQMFLVSRNRSTNVQESMILVEQLIAILIGCVCTFSELEKEVDSLHIGAETRGLDQSEWISREDRLNKLLDRLKDHKLSILLMLNILSCQSVEEAERSTKRLSELVSKLLENQKSILEWMQRTGTTLTPSLLSGSTVTPSVRSKMDSEATAVSKGGQSMRKSRSLSLHNYLNRRSSTSSPISKGFTFDPDLAVSRVYKSTLDHRSLSRPYYPTANQYNRISARLSLADVANPSFLTLPLFSSEILNSRWYNFGSGKLFFDAWKWGNINSFLPYLRIQRTKSTTPRVQRPKIVSARVESFFISNELVYYWLNIVTEDNTTLRLCRLYQDFYQFHLALLNLFPNEVGKTIPWLPYPTLWLLESEVSSSVLASEDCPDKLRQQLDKYINTVLSKATKISRSPPAMLFVWRRNEVYDKYKESAISKELVEMSAYKDEVDLKEPSAPAIVEKVSPPITQEEAAPCQGLGLVFKRVRPKVPTIVPSVHYRKNTFYD